MKLGLPALALLTSCQSLADGARESFSTEFTCPPARVEVRAREDIHASVFHPPEAPPAEVAADPERLKLWQANEAQRQETDDAYDDVLEARGCGHQTLYTCHKNQNRGWVMCQAKDYPAGVGRW